MNILINHAVDKSITESIKQYNQWDSQSINRSMDQPINVCDVNNQPFDCKYACICIYVCINQLVHPYLNQSISQPIKQPTNQSTNSPSKSTNQPTVWPIKNQWPINRPINQQLLPRCGNTIYGRVPTGDTGTNERAFEWRSCASGPAQGRTTSRCERTISASRRTLSWSAKLCKKGENRERYWRPKQI